MNARILISIVAVGLAGCSSYSTARRMDAIAQSAMGPTPPALQQKKAEEERAQITDDIKTAIKQAQAAQPARNVPTSIIVEHTTDVFAEPAPARHTYVDMPSTGYLGD